ncbi:MAG: hydroxyethylthiazole kinase, partial [Planctomycetia bacterium]|nr:hydroxyethylthiazole kinase [Planctomycetia bacterium]
MKTCLDRVRQFKPLVHCITNYVTVADCARVLAASGASPIMADAPAEIVEIQAIANALCVNIGTIRPQMVPGMLRAARIAWQKGHPAVLDPVGAGASRLRSETAKTLIKSGHFTLVRGNMSEIRALGQIETKPRGTDVASEDEITERNLEEGIKVASKLARQWNTLVGISGQIDIIAAPDGHNAIVENGHEIMPRLPGTGCMLSALCAAFLGANPSEPFKATLAAFCTMGISGELAFSELKPGEGPAMWHLRFIDVIARLT